MFFAGLLLTGLGLVFLMVCQFIPYRKLPGGYRRGQGVVLDVRPANNEIRLRYTADKDTRTISIPQQNPDHFYPGQQLVVYYSADDPSQPLLLLSYSQAWGKQFLFTLLSLLLIVAGALLIRFGEAPT